MEHKAGRFPLGSNLFILACFLCIELFFACTDNNIIPASKIDGGKVTLSWENAPGVISYNIYFARTAGVTKLNSSKIPNAANPITVTDLVLGQTYYFGITVVSESGESGILREKTYTASDQEGFINFGDLTPEDQNLKGQAIKEQVPEGPVTLTWDNVPNAISYNIYWSESPGVSKKKGNKIENVTNPYRIMGLKSGKTYYFVITAVNNSGESNESEELSFSVK